MTTKLSKKQEKVLKLYLAGYKPIEIGKLMKLSINTVCNYKSIIMEKWEVENNVELVLEAVRRGYVDFEDWERRKTIQFIYTNHTFTYDTYVYFKSQRKNYIYTCAFMDS